MTRTALALAFVTLAVAAGACTADAGSPAVRVGAVYPLSGSQGPGGVDEHRGVLLAAELTNADGGVQGRPVEITSIDVAGSDAAALAVADLDEAGIDIVVGSYGSTISAPASVEAASRGMLFWETGAVGMLPPGAGRGELTFRVPPTGAVLGRTAIGFVADQLSPELGRDPDDLRFAVAYVDDVYGSSVAAGAIDALTERGLIDVGAFAYDFRTVDYGALARRIARARPDVLFVSAYLEDGIDLRRALLEQDVPLVASIGTSSSYCMPEFGDELGLDAVGLFASDKPAADAIDPDGLRPDGAALLERANAAYLDRYGEPMSPAALAGFSAAWALFRHVMPDAVRLDASAIAAAARAVDLPAGSLPNGSGLRFGATGTATAGDNEAAASVVWEWVAPGVSEVVWPPGLATHPIEAMDIT